MKAEHDLLQPSLTADASPGTAIYSKQAAFLTSFFGGPIAALAIAGVNSSRLKRLKQDLPFYAGGLALCVAAIWVIFDSALTKTLSAELGKRGPNLAFRLLGIIYFGGMYLLHKQYWRSMEIMGIDAPNGWRAAIPCIAIGLLSLAALLYFIGPVKP